MLKAKIHCGAHYIALIRSDILRHGGNTEVRCFLLFDEGIEEYEPISSKPSLDIVGKNQTDMKSIKLIAIHSFIAISFLFHSEVIAQQRKIPKSPFKFSDAVTGKPIPKVLVVPRYYSATGIFIAPEGPAKGTYRNYLDKPFVYRTGDPFKLKTPKFTGLPLFPVLIGKGKSIEGILIVAPKYRPIWFDNLWQTHDIWNTHNIRDLQLTPIPDNEWSLLLEKKLNPLTKEAILPVDDFRFWGLYETERGLYIDYNKDERELVRSFLQSAKIESK